MLIKSFMITLIALALSACQSLSTPNEQISDLNAANEATIEAVKKIDSFYLVPCQTPAKSTSDEITYLMKYFDTLLTDYAKDCKRMNVLIEQVK